MIQPNWKYNVEVTAASLVRSQTKGTLGLQLSLETDDTDTITHTIWITKETMASAEKALDSLGVKPDDLKKKIFWENVGSIIVGRKCSITTIEREYKGKKSVQVQWLNRPLGEVDDTDLATAAADLFETVPF